MSTHLMLSAGVRLRAEHFGGIVCDTHTGTILEVDREAFSLLWELQTRGSVPDDRLPAEHGAGGGTDRRLAERVMRRLVELGILQPCDAHPDTPERPVPVLTWPKGPHLTAPETVHWAATYRCLADCPDCYARRYRALCGPELPTELALGLVDRLADWGVLQLAVGGGEPTLRPDLPVICRAARERGLIAHVTTGDMVALEAHLHALAGGPQAVQVGLKSRELLADPAAQASALRRAVRTGERLGVSLGANIMLSAPEVRSLQRLLESVADAGVRRVTLLRYKPPADPVRWLDAQPLPAAVAAISQSVSTFAQAHPHVSIRIDCALSFLQAGLSREEARSAGIRGCVAASRILALSADAGVYPCSQLVHPRLRAGSALTGDLDAVWTRSPVMRRYRYFRRLRQFRASACGSCSAKAHCGGCRIFAPDALGADPGCPLAEAASDRVRPYPRWLQDSITVNAGG